MYWSCGRPSRPPMASRSRVCTWDHREPATFPWPTSPRAFVQADQSFAPWLCPPAFWSGRMIWFFPFLTDSEPSVLLRSWFREYSLAQFRTVSNMSFWIWMCSSRMAGWWKARRTSLTTSSTGTAVCSQAYSTRLRRVVCQPSGFSSYGMGNTHGTVYCRMVDATLPAHGFRMLVKWSLDSIE